MNSFSVEQKRVDVFESAAPNKPVIYLNTYGREGAQIFQYLTDIGCQDFSLVAVSKLEWNHDMVPWDIPPIFKNGASYTSGADEYLRLLINQIIPKAESLLQGIPAWRGIAGIFTGRTVCTVFYLSDGRLFASCECLRLAVVSGN